MSFADTSSLASWTDDLPVCRQSGIGFAANELYRKDGRRTEMHPVEDRSFHFSVDEFGVRVYGVFDGFSGDKVSDFIAKKLPAELCLGQISQNTPDETVRDVLRQSFKSIDQEYFNFIGDKLALRMEKRLQNPSDQQLVQLDLETLSGASATVSVLIDNKKVFVANVGDVRAVICTVNSEGDIRALPLSVDHLTSNEDEKLRLTQLGLDVDLVNKITERSRCIGFHQAKGGYQEVEYLKEAKDEPVTATPEIHGPFHIQSNHLFMLIFTSSLAKCLEQITSSFDGDVNTEICRITREQFLENTTVSGVAQSVVDKVVRMHRDHFETEVDDNNWRREDVSLLVRNFNAKLANIRRNKSTSSSASNPGTPNLINNLDAVTMTKESAQKPIMLPPDATRSSTTTDSSADTFLKQERELSLDENGRIKAYVDFSHFHSEWAKHQSPGQNGV